MIASLVTDEQTKGTNGPVENVESIVRPSVHAV